jgi:hypothetical protein
VRPRLLLAMLQPQIHAFRLIFLNAAKRLKIKLAVRKLLSPKRSVPLWVLLQSLPVCPLERVLVVTLNVC